MSPCNPAPLVASLALALWAGSQPALGADPAPGRDYPSTAKVGLSRMAFRYRGPLLGVSYTELLGSPAVRSEIGLTKPQEGKLFGRAWSEHRAEVDRLGREARQVGVGEKREGLRREIESRSARVDVALKSVLDVAQRARLEGIALQQAGPRALLSPSVASPLRLDADQEEMIREILAPPPARQVEGEEAGLRPGADGKTTEQDRAKVAEFWARVRAQDRASASSEAWQTSSIRRVLRPSQRRRLDGLFGRTFDVGKLTIAHEFSSRQSPEGPSPAR